MRRRAFIRATAGTFAAGVSTACVDPRRLVGDGRPTPTLGLPPSTPTPARVRRAPADTLVLGFADEPSSLALPPTHPTGRLVGNLLFSQLVGLDDRGVPRPDLVEQVPTLENGGARLVGDGEARHLEITFRLRPDLRWSDGAPLIARDVVFTWLLAHNPFVGATIETETRWERFAAADDRTIVAALFSERSAREAARAAPNRHGFLAEQRGPVLDSFYFLGLPHSWILPEHVLTPLVDGDPRRSPRARDLFTRGPFAAAPIGSGAYALREWRSGGAGILLGARPGFHGRPPSIGNVLLLAPPLGVQRAQQPADAGSLETQVESLRTGGVDLLALEPGQARLTQRFEDMPGVRLAYVPSTALERIDLNLDHAALSDPRVRAGLLQALDRRALSISVFGERIGAEAAAWTNVAARYSYDPGAAERLLDAAGWPRASADRRAREGQPLGLRLAFVDTRARAALARQIADQLERVGVDIALSPTSDLLEPGKGRLSRRDFDLALYGSEGGPDRLTDLAAMYHSAAIPSARSSFAGANSAGLRNVELDRVLDSAATTLDTDGRRRLLEQANELLAGDLPTLPLFVYPRAAAMSAELGGVRVPAPPIGLTWNANEWTLA